ncbi:MAG: ATP-binding protein [Trueperaceae bacterium]|nr:ATP-binding protein [Trueperaceae bacterium]
MSAYLPRLQDAVLLDLLQGLPAVAIDGAKGVGKTSTAERVAGTVLQVDRPEVAESLRNDPGLIRRLKPPVLLDEWQYVPQLWNSVRRSVDEDYRPGQFLLAGSASPRAEERLHSGAGRIVRLRMRPLSIEERGLDEPSVRLADLLTGTASEASRNTDVGFGRYLHEITASGFPAIRQLPDRYRDAQLDSYVANVVEHDFPEQGLRVRRPQTLFAWLKAYAAATAGTASYTTILDAATSGGSDKPTKVTTGAWRDMLSRLWLLDPVEAWLPGDNAFGRLSAAPKHFLADPALAARLLNITSARLETGAVDHVIGPQGGTVAGRLFEALVAQSLQVYASVNEARLYHFRSEAGHREIDFIVERGNIVVAVEVKLSPSVSDDDVRHLHWLGERVGPALAAKVVVNTGPTSYRRRDGVWVVPAALLGA